MSKEVEQRVVEMRFDNKQFESNVSTTMSTIDKLKQKLNFTGAGKSLESINDSAKKVDMSGLAKGVEAIQMKFSALQVIGVTALANITNSAVNAGKQIVSALTIDPIKTGFEEYETQINAVQTILANTQSKGSTLSDVNKALNELNTYADQTIYNFTEMTRNIGTFTAAGVELDKSVSAIKGIANLAAVSGSTSLQASTAMYQLSQALAAGRATLMDWNSVVNAGMGGEIFQNSLVESGIRYYTQMLKEAKNEIDQFNASSALDILQKIQDGSATFRDTLSEEWLTSEVLLETLSKFTGDLSESQLRSMGYTEEQIAGIIEMGKTANDAATKVKTFTQLWDTLKEAAQSGWTQTWQILVGDFEEAKSLLTELSDTFGAIIGQAAESRNNLLYDAMTSNWKKITDGITEAGLSAEDFKDKVSEIGKKEVANFDEIVEDAGSLEAAFKSGALSSDLLNKALIKMTGSSTEISKKLDDLKGKYKTNKDILEALKNAGYGYNETLELRKKNIRGEEIALNDLSDAQLMSIGYTAEQVQTIRDLSAYAELAGGSLKTFMDNVSVPQGRELLVDVLRVSIRSLISVFEAVGKAWRDVFPPTTSEQLLGIVQSFRDLVLSLRPSEETLDKIQRTFRGLFSVLSIGKQILTAILSPIGTLISRVAGLSGGFLDITAAIGDWLFALNESIKAGGSFTVVGEGISTVVNAIFDAFQSVTSGLGGFKGIISGVGKAVLFVFDGIKDGISDALGWIRDNISATDIFAGLAGGGAFVLFKKFGNLVDKIKEIFEGFGDKSPSGGISEILGSIHDSLESFQQGIKVASLVGIATAVMLLTSSLRKIAELDAIEVAYSLVTIRLMIASLTSGFKSLSKTLSKFNSKGVVKSSVALIGIATAINILASAMEKMSDLSWGDVARGLTVISVSLAAMSAAMKVISNSSVTLRSSVAIIALAQACKMLAEAMQGFGGLSWGEIARGLTAMGVALAELTAVLVVMSKIGGGKSLLGATSLLIAVQSLDEISENLKRLGSLSWGEIGKGLTAMGGALLEFTAVLAILGKVGGFGAILGGTAILIAVQSLDEISENLKRLGEMTWGEIGSGLAAMGGALAELGAISGLLGKLAGFSGLIGAGSILLAAQSLDEIADTLVKLGDMAWDEIGRGLTAMGGALAEIGTVSGLLGKLGGFSSLIGAGSILLAVQGLGDIADAMQKFGSMAWDEIGRGLVAMGGAMGEIAVINGLTGTFAGFAGLVGGGTILLTVQGLGQLADAFQKFGSMSWDEIGRGLSAMGGALSETALGGIVNTFSGFGAAAIADMAEPLGTLADSIKKWQGVSVPEGLGTNIGSLADGITKFTFGGAGAKALATFAAPIGDLADSVKKWTNVIVPEGLSAQLASLATGIDAFTFGGFGASGLAASVAPIGDMAGAISKWSNVKIPENIEEGLTSIAKGIQEFTFAFVGGFSLESLGPKLVSFGENFKKYSDYMAGVDTNVVTNTTNAAQSLVALSKNLPENKLFTNETWLDEFGEQLSEFGRYFSIYYGYVSPIDSGKLSSAISEIGKLIGMARDMSNIDLSSMSSFGKALGNLGKTGVEELINAFKNSTARVSEAATALMTSANNGLKSMDETIQNTVILIINKVITNIQNKYPDFETAGKTSMVRFISGVTSKSTATVNAFTAIISRSLISIRNKYNDFVQVGKYLVEGVANGIELYTYVAEQAAKEMAKRAMEAAKDAIDAHSPSREGIKIGGYFGQGFIIGIRNYADASYNAGSSMAETAMDGLSKAISEIPTMVANDFDVEPKIRPVIDLSDVNAKANQLNAMFSRNQAMSISSSLETSGQVEVQNGEAYKLGSTFSFVQNNYSPKALSRVEIYRQTKNQFSAMERMVQA